MKKHLLAMLLPAAMLLAACGPTNSSSTPVESTSETDDPVTSTSETEDGEDEESTTPIEIPTVVPTVHLTVEGIEVSEENGIFIGSPNIEGANADTWGYEEATKQEDGTYTYTFPEIEVENIIIYKVYVQAKAGNPWTGIACDECPGNDTELTILTLEGQNDYYQTVTFSSQPDSSEVLSEATFRLTATDADGNPITQEGLYIVAWDSQYGDGHLTVWNHEGNGVYTYTYADIAYGSFTINPFLENTNDTTAISWNKSDTLGNAGYKFDITADQTVYEFAAKWSSIPEVSTSEGYAVTFNLNLENALVGGDAQPQVVVGSSWLKMTGSETTWTYTATLEGEISFYFYWWDGGAGRQIHADANWTNFSATISADTTLTVTGDFAAEINVGTLA